MCFVSYYINTKISWIFEHVAYLLNSLYLYPILDILQGCRHDTLLYLLVIPKFDANNWLTVLWFQEFLSNQLIYKQNYLTFDLTLMYTTTTPGRSGSGSKGNKVVMILSQELDNCKLITIISLVSFPKQKHIVCMFKY